MIQEDYVSFEIAKLLKEKGFDEPLNYYYNSDGRKGYASSYNWNQTTGDFQDYSCPTLQMATKWLREKYYIYADPIKQGNYNDCSEYYTWIVAQMGIIHRNASVIDKLYYKQAAEAALKYALENLI